MNLKQFFNDHPYITMAGVAAKAGISYQSLRLELLGKYTNPQRLVLIEQAIHAMAQELLLVKIDNTN